MAEELQGLLDRIHKEGLDKAEEERQAIIAQAHQQATEIRTAAEKQAARIREEAEEEARKFEQRSVSAVQQAARDVVLSVGDAVEKAFSALIAGKMETALNDEAFAQTVREVITAYTRQTESASIDVLLPPEQQEAVRSYLLKSMTEEMKQGIKIQSDRGILSGFAVVLREQGVEHDFRGETLTSAFLQLLRPELGEIVKQAMEKIKQSP